MKKNIIKVGYLISYDYEYLPNSLNQIYKYVDSITLCYDIEFKTWSGNTFTIPDSFFEVIKKMDVDNKIKIYKDKFYIPNSAPMELETRQRNMLSQFMGEGGWHLQIDSDEYAYDFEKLVRFLKSKKYLLRNPKKTPVTFLVKWIMLYKQDKEGFYVISPANETIYMITNCPNYSYARKTETKIFILDFYFIHQSWARSESEIEDKIKNWGHKNDFDTNTFFENWKNLNKNNYRDFKNFHPLNKETWQELEFIEAKNLEDFIQICKKNKPQGVLEMKMKLSKKIKLYIKSLF